MISLIALAGLTLIVAELIVHSRIGPAVRRLVERRLIVPEDMPKFAVAIDSAMRVRNSVTVEITLLVLVYTVGLWIWRSQIATGAASWYAMPEGTQLHLTFAGYWYALVSIPIFQFILVRWYLRLFIWFQFLWRVSRLNLRLIATHPDRAAGIGFLGHSAYAFGPILFAQGVLLAGVIASRVLHDGQNLMAFKMEAGGFVAFFILFLLSPLVLFTPHTSRARNGKASVITASSPVVMSGGSIKSGSKEAQATKTFSAPATSNRSRTLETVMRSFRKCA